MSFLLGIAIYIVFYVSTGFLKDPDKQLWRFVWQIVLTVALSVLHVLCFYAYREGIRIEPLNYLDGVFIALGWVGVFITLDDWKKAKRADFIEKLTEKYRKAS